MFKEGHVIGVIHKEKEGLRPALISKVKGDQALIVIEEVLNDLMHGCYSRISSAWWIKNTNKLPVNQILPGFEELMHPVTESIELKEIFEEEN